MHALRSGHHDRELAKLECSVDPIRLAGGMRGAAEMDYAAHPGIGQVLDTLSESDQEPSWSRSLLASMRSGVLNPSLNHR